MLQINIPPGTRIHPSAWHLLSAEQLYEQQGYYRHDNGGAMPPKVGTRNVIRVVEHHVEPQEAADRLMAELQAEAKAIAEAHARAEAAGRPRSARQPLIDLGPKGPAAGPDGMHGGDGSGI
jgi:hypothetical protein